RPIGLAFAAAHFIMAAPYRACIRSRSLELVLERKLDQTRIDRGGRNPAEVRRLSQIQPRRNGKLRMVERVIELRAELQGRIFAQPTHSEQLRQADVPVVLSGTENNSLAGIPKARATDTCRRRQSCQGTSGSGSRRRFKCRSIEVGPDHLLA